MHDIQSWKRRDISGKIGPMSRSSFLYFRAGVFLSLDSSHPHQFISRLCECSDSNRLENNLTVKWNGLLLDVGLWGILDSSLRAVRPPCCSSSSGIWCVYFLYIAAYRLTKKLQYLAVEARCWTRRRCSSSEGIQPPRRLSKPWEAG